uniref:Uncharacterized protein n=1 Tax=Anguilla anguilla TaxID=7936 RepID=A0A0E9UNG0_ANGAN
MHTSHHFCNFPLSIQVTEL